MSETDTSASETGFMSPYTLQMKSSLDGEFSQIESNHLYISQYSTLSPPLLQRWLNGNQERDDPCATQGPTPDP